MESSQSKTFQRSTKQRQVILDELCKLKSHPSASELYQQVRKRLPKISLGTVYRNLEIMAKRGTIHKLSLGEAEARFDGDTDDHHHVRCIHCGRVDDVYNVSLELKVPEGEDLGEYQILGHTFELQGICPDCAKGSE